MNFSETISNKLTEVITNEINCKDDKKEIIAYAIETAVLIVAGFFLLAILGYFLNALMPTLIAAIFGGSLRRVSGGAHFSTPVKCLAFGSIVYSFLGVFSTFINTYGFTNQYVLIVCLLVSLLLVAFLAPVDSEAKPIQSSSLKSKLKISSIVFIIISFIVAFFINNHLISISVVLGLVYQSLTLLPIFNKRGGECRL